MPEQAVFIGEKAHALDEKNRVTLPAIFRERVHPKVDGKTFFLTLGLDRCLFLYTARRWSELSSKLAREPFTKKAAREFQRMFFGSAVEVEPDRAGRILLPESLKEFIGIGKEVVLMGVVDRIEVWDAAVWQEKKKAGLGQYEALAEQLFHGEVDFE